MIPLEDRIRLSLLSAANAAAVPPAPTGPAPVGRRSRARRLAVTVACAVLVPCTGVGLAAAAGILPASVERAFSFSRSYPVDAGSLRLAGTVPGPAGFRFQLWTRTGTAGTSCYLTSLVPDTDPAGQPSAALRSGGGWCPRNNDPHIDPRVFAGTGGGSTTRTETLFIYYAGPATRADVLLTDGTHIHTVVTHGQVAGWLPTSRSHGAQLIGYDKHGHIIGRRPLSVPSG